MKYYYNRFEIMILVRELGEKSSSRELNHFTTGSVTPRVYCRYDGIVDLSSAECYDPNLNKWSAVTSLGTKRSCLGISANHGLLYVCGGFDGASCLSSVERYDPLTGVWSSCASMTTRRRYCRVSVVGKSFPPIPSSHTNIRNTTTRTPHISHIFQLNQSN